MKPNQTLICAAARGIHNLTQGKEYVCLYGLEEGIFADRPAELVAWIAANHF